MQMGKDGPDHHEYHQASHNVASLESLVREGISSQEEYSVLLGRVESPSDPPSGEGACPDKGKSAPSKVGGSGGSFKRKATPVASSGRLGRGCLCQGAWVVPCGSLHVTW